MDRKTELFRAKVIVKKDEIEKKLADARGELDSLQANFASAWESHGSELAGRPPGEEKLTEEVRTLERRLAVLEKYLKGDILPETADDLTKAINKCLQEERALQERRQGSEQILEEIDMLKFLIGEK